MKKLLTVVLVTVMLAGMGAVAHAIPVKLLPEPTAAGVACDNCVDEARLLKELQAWQKRYNALLRSLEKKPDAETYRAMADTIWANPTPDAGSFEQLLGPVLTRWYNDAMTSKDKQLLQILQRYGIIPSIFDDCTYLKADLTFFRTRFTVPRAAESFIVVLNAQPSEYVLNEGVRRFGYDEIAKWLIARDLLLQDAAGQPCKDAAQSRYLCLLNLLLFHKNHDMPVNERESDTDGWCKALQQCIAAHPDTLTAALLKAALDDTKGKTCVVSNAAQKAILAQTKAGLSGDKGKAAAVAQSAALSADAPCITLTVTPGAVIKFSAGAAAEGTPIWLEIAPGVLTQTTVGTDMEKHTMTVTARGTTFQIYGSITRFDCTRRGGENKINALDISTNSVLQELKCSFNNLSELDVRKNTALKVLHCGWNKLTTLDVSQNTALQTLDLIDNKLTELDVRNNSALQELTCEGNPLTTLDVSKNAALQILHCYDTKLTALDLSANHALQKLRCGTETLRTLTLSNKARMRQLDYHGAPLTEEKIQYR